VGPNPLLMRMVLRCIYAFDNLFFKFCAYILLKEILPKLRSILEKTWAKSILNCGINKNIDD
jgi:hypothetical protein